VCPLRAGRRRLESTSIPSISGCAGVGALNPPRSRTSRRRGVDRVLRPALLARAEDVRDDLTAALAGITQWRKHGREPLAARRCWGQRAVVEVFTERWVKAGHVQPKLRRTAKEHTVELAGRGLMGALAVNVFASAHGTISLAVCSAPRGTPSVISGRTLPGNSEPLRHAKRASRTRVQARSCPGNPSRVRSGRRQHATTRCVRS
jgi:hypothetical protein